MLRHLRVLATLSIWLIAVTTSGQQPKFFDTGKASRFIETSVHVMGGGSTIFHNYESAFSEIENMNTNMGALLGFGGRATIGFREYLGLTTEINLLVRNYNLDMAVVGSSESTMSAVFVNSRSYSLSFPILITLRFKVARSVKWNVDFGPYYSYGIGGRQKQRIFVGKVNEGMGQLIGEQISITSPYYNSASTFQNSFRRSDYGIHIGTSLDLGPHLQVGARIQAGLKNTSFTQGIVNPRVRNFDVAGIFGWRF